MKKLLITAFAILISSQSYSQNTFPQTGNAGIGETNSGASLTIFNSTPYVDNELLRLKSGIAWGGNTGHMSLYNGSVENARFAWFMGDGNLQDGNLLFYTKEGGGTLQERLRIKHNGNVGIGTSSPDSRLHIGLSNGAQLRVDYNNTGDNYYDANKHIFRGNGGFSEILYLNGATSRVGIGTTIPTSKLEVWDITSGSGISQMLNLSNGSDADLNFKVSQVGATQKYFSISPSVAIPIALATTTGVNVGIGTSTPGAKLDVNGIIQTYNKDANFATWDNLRVWSEGENSYIESNGDEKGLVIKSNGGNKILLKSKVGVGVENPQENLEVNGTIRSEVWRPTGSEQDDFYLDVEPGTRILRTRNWNTSAPNIGATGLHTGVGFFDGSVGIGTANLTEKLNVNGSIRAQAVKVSAEGWPDYVFEPSYKLPDLQVTEQFIKENKHLPEIPSAKEVQSNGIELGQMNALLLKKIEELTLHLIQLSKKVDEQQAQIIKLKTSK